MYLLRGGPGAGKTTMAMQYLLQGVAEGETSLYVTLSESEDELHEVAVSHGWSLDGIHIYEHFERDPSVVAELQQTMFHPVEVELSEVTQTLMEVVKRVRPQRLVIDSLSEMRLLAGDDFRYRRQVLALKHYFAAQGITSVLTDELIMGGGDTNLQSIAHGVITLDQELPKFGTDQRRLRINKVRGLPILGGYHDYAIRTGGVVVYPRLVVAAGFRRTGSEGVLCSGVGSLDALLGGGLDRGSTTMLLGPSGTGKSTVALLYAVAAAQRGERAMIYLFDESRRMATKRAAGLGIALADHLESGRIVIKEQDPAETIPGEFAFGLREAVEEQGVRVVVIDSLSGYLRSMPDERASLLRLYELMTYLGRTDVTTLITAPQAFAGFDPQDRHGSGPSYLADTMVLLGYFDFAGSVRIAVSVFKRRSGQHERTIRELQLVPGKGVVVGPPLSQFNGVLTGTPTYDQSRPLPDAQD